MMTGTSKRTPQGRTTVIEAIENATALMLTLQGTIEHISEHSMTLSSMAKRGELAVETGNLRLAAEIFSDVERESEKQRKLLAGMQTTAEAARAHLAAARGE